jgi:phenylpyruvate tautomerase PptA (4-oxalocrotonate tautomerase family)
MPIVHVHLKKGTSPEYRGSIAAAIKDALLGVLELPDDDYNQITFEHEPENMIYDPNFFGLPRSEKMIFVSMSFNQRSPQLKQKLFETVANNIVGAVGIGIEDVMMNIVEIARENWWAHGRTVNPETGFDSRMVNAPT